MIRMDFLPIPDPGVKKGTRSRIWMRNTDFKALYFDAQKYKLGFMRIRTK
jgi:hypothetical protein